jgi:hypothetical protein
MNMYVFMHVFLCVCISIYKYMCIYVGNFCAWSSIYVLGMCVRTYIRLRSLYMCVCMYAYYVCV